VISARALPAALAVVLAFTAACGPDAPLRVDTIQLGRSLNPDNSVASHTTQFRPEDTVYVSILTAEAGAGTIGVRWTYGGRVVDEPKKEVAYNGPAATEFHLNSAGFPLGEYKVEVFLDGQPAGSRTFRVDK
jgi:hypothetical protein